MDREEQWVTKYTQFIKSEQYMNQPIEFYHDEKHTKTLMKYIQQLTPSPQNFQIAKNLMKFYRMSVFICFRNLYERLAASSTEVKDQCEDQVKYLALYVQETIKGLTIPELSFFFVHGVSKKRLKLAEKAAEQIKFMIYIDSLSKAFIKFKTVCKSGTMNQKKNALNQFESLSANFELKFIQKNFETILKSQAIPYIAQIQKSEQEDQVLTKQFLKDMANIPLNQIPLCCRTYFKLDQTIEQPQSLTIEYKFYTFPFNDQKEETIKKTMCGLLNGDGGCIYFGVKEDKLTKKRVAIGHFLDQKKKIDFKNEILDLFKLVLPEQGKSCEISFVPIKKGQDYVSGKYIIKVIIKYGARDRVYSFVHQQIERFAIKTENEVLQIREPQKILKIQRDRLLKTPPPPKPLHKHQCPKPDRGKLIYNSQIPFSDLKEEAQQQFQVPSYEQRVIKQPPRKYFQKNCLDYLILMNSEKFKEKYLQTQISRKINLEILAEGADFILIHLAKVEQINQIKEIFPQTEFLNVYNRVKVDGDEKLLDQIYNDLKETFKIVRNNGEHFFQHKTSADAAKLYMKLKEMGISCKFEAASS